MMAAPNRNLLHARIIADELAKSGVHDVVIAPGSRSTPLVFAFVQDTRFRCHSIIDERGAGFFALGLALAGKKPVVLVCTSGSAMTHFFPAIVEAHESQVALIVLSADRPPELRDSGANQTIDQVGLFGSFAKFAVDVAMPEGDPPALVRRQLRTLAGRAANIASDWPRGVVHLNVPFRKPLEPTEVEADLKTDDTEREGRPFVRFSSSSRAFDSAHVSEIAQHLIRARRGLILCGPGARADEFAQSLLTLSRATGFPILADPLSGIRYGQASQAIISTAQSILSVHPEMAAVDMVIQFGAPLTSQSAENAFHQFPPPIWITHDMGRWSDPDFHTTDILSGNARLVVEALLEQVQHKLNGDADHEWLERWQQYERHAVALMADYCADRWFDGSVAASLVNRLPAESVLVVGNSLSIRHVDQFGCRTSHQLPVFCNRGASGIDGTIATAAGIAVAEPSRSVFVLLGDLAFLHDLNSLHLLRRTAARLTIIVVNNDGGAIFRRLPVSRFDPPYTEWFETPHGLSFGAAAAQFGLSYIHAATRQEFEAALSQTADAGQSVLIEVTTDAGDDEAAFHSFVSQMHSTLSTEILQKEHL